MAFNWFKKKKDEGQTGEPDKQADSIVSKRQEGAAAEAEKTSDKSFFQRLRSGLAKTRKVLTTDIDELFTGKAYLDDEMLEDLEELLITSDIGVQTAMDLISKISKRGADIDSPAKLKAVLKEELLSLMTESVGQSVSEPSSDAPGRKPFVIMAVGVNGVGKTTTIAKLAAKYRKEGKKVLLVAADTFRAAAVEQLAVWAERSDVELIRHKENADPSAVVYDGVEAALARQMDVVIIDTAGRLHTRINLMEELKKIKRTAAKKIPDSPHETLLVLDATTGQNAVSQARQFDEALDITGLALTKLDGTAKGGIVVSICHTHKIPIKYVGVGEQIDDLQVFDPEKFIEALF